MRILLHTPKTIAVYLQHSGLGPTRELGDVMRRSRPREEDDRKSRRAPKPRDGARKTKRSTSQRTGTNVTLTPSACPDCGGQRELRVNDGGFQAECMQCHATEPVTLASLYSIVERTGVQCLVCGQLMEVCWAPAHQYYLRCKGGCGNTVTAGALRQ